MDFASPYGQMFATPLSATIVGSPDAAFERLLGAAKVRLTRSGLRVPPSELFIGWFGQATNCTVQIIGTHPEMLALYFVAGDAAFYAVLARYDGEWKFAPRVLGLPHPDPPRWGTGGEANRQRDALLYAFVARGKLERWL